MRKIVLHSAAVDRHGKYRDAGETLSVGSDDNLDTDLTTARADELLAGFGAVTLGEERDALARAEKVADPLDHDADGRKGGSLAKSKTNP